MVHCDRVNIVLQIRTVLPVPSHLLPGQSGLTSVSWVYPVTSSPQHMPRATQTTLTGSFDVEKQELYYRTTGLLILFLSLRLWGLELVSQILA